MGSTLSAGPGSSSSATGEQLSALRSCSTPFCTPNLRLPSLFHSKLEPLRSSFSDELVIVAIIPLSLLSRVELGLLMVSQGLLLAAVLLTQLFKVEQGLSVLGDAVLLVSVEQGLMPWLRAVHMVSFFSSMVICVALGMPSPSKNPSLVNSS